MIHIACAILFVIKPSARVSKPTPPDEVIVELRGHLRSQFDVPLSSTPASEFSECGPTGADSGRHTVVVVCECELNKRVVVESKLHWGTGLN